MKQEKSIKNSLLSVTIKKLRKSSLGSGDLEAIQIRLKRL